MYYIYISLSSWIYPQNIVAPKDVPGPSIVGAGCWLKADANTAVTSVATPAGEDKLTLIDLSWGVI